MRTSMDVGVESDVTTMAVVSPVHAQETKPAVIPVPPLVFLRAVRPEHGIDTIEELREHLQWALMLEHCTIPPYLCALYSLHEGRNQAAAQVLQSVAMEEMLHMTLAANVLNAVGGAPRLNTPDFVPEYPTHLPHSDGAFEVSLLPFSRPAFKTFLRIEHPARRDAPPQPDHYATIGQFYAAIEDGLKRVCAGNAHFTGNPARQVTAEYYYGGGGEVFPVTDIDSALEALCVITDQGEGIDHTIFDDDHRRFGQEAELAHYFRFMQIWRERYYTDHDTPRTGPTGDPFPVDWTAVYPMRPNPRARDYPVGSAIRARLEEFNRTYSRLLDTLHEAFNGRPERLLDAANRMYALRYQALALMKTPAGDGQTVGASFEYVPQAGVES